LTQFPVTASIIVWLPFYFNVCLLVWGLLVSWRMNKSFEGLKNDPARFIIQICTNGRAPKSVNSIVERVRSYALEFPHEIWVIVEDYDSNSYEADRVVRVPSDFATPHGAGAKARALEFARQVRMREGIEDEYTKILFLDDDSFPDREYLAYAFHSPIDIAHGYIRTDREYGTNLLTSVADNFRVTDCLATCPTFASIGKPMLIHGEGLVVRGNVEREVTWDRGGESSWGEDLTFGTSASHKFRYGFIPYTVHIASPFSVHDLYRQRRRWIWGGIKSFSQLSLTERSFLAARIYCGIMSLPSIALSAYVALSGTTFPLSLRIIFSLGTVAFVGYYLIGSWLNTHRPSKVAQTLVLFWAAAIVESPVMLYSVLRRPRTFEVIRKE
jgi:cellulose synthase/poly-beta-1,6-N-acetylglucosamine synthase-like glycosyltransferase